MATVLERLRFELTHASPVPWWTGSMNSCRWVRMRPGPPVQPDVDGSGKDEYGFAMGGPNPDGDAELLVAAVNALPALLSLAEAINNSKKLSNGVCNCEPGCRPCENCDRHYEEVKAVDTALSALNAEVKE